MPSLKIDKIKTLLKLKYTIVLLGGRVQNEIGRADGGRQHDGYSRMIYVGSLGDVLVIPETILDELI